MKIRYIFAILITIFIATGCSLNILPEEDTVRSTSTPNSSKGQVTLRIPLIPSYLSEDLQKPDSDEKPDKKTITNTTNSKAIGYCSNATLIISDADGDPVGEYPLLSDHTSDYMQGSVILAPGTGYTASIDIYNYAISETEPVTSGTSSEFSVTEGENTFVYITAFPTSPAALSLDTAVSISAATPSTFNRNLWEVTETGGEYWFLLEDVSNDSTTIQISHSSSDSYAGYVEIAVFDEYGYNIGTKLSPGVQNSGFDGDLTIDYSFLSTIGNDYYICIIPMTVTGDTSAEFTITYTDGPTDDEYEDNDDSASATELTESTMLSAVSIDNDYYTFTLTEETYISIDCLLTTLGSSIDFYLYDDSGNYITGIYCSDLGGQITRTLSAGTYNIILYGYSSSFGVGYQIGWEAITDDEYEDNDNSTTATPLTEGSEITARYMDYDFYTFTLTDERIVSIEFSTTASNADFLVTLYNSTGDTITNRYCYSPSGKLDQILTSGTYFIGISESYNCMDHRYNLVWNSSEIPADDEYEDNENYNDATPIAEATTLSAVFLDYDGYTFTLSQERMVEIECGITASDASVYFDIINDSGEYFGGTSFSIYNGLYVAVLPAGTYFMSIYQNENSLGIDYTLNWNSSEAPPDDGYEDNDSADTATPIASDTTLSAISIDSDWYTFSLASESSVTISCNFLNSEGNIDINLINSVSGYITGSTSSNDNETISTTLATGTYYIIVYRQNGLSSDYTISWSQ